MHDSILSKDGRYFSVSSSNLRKRRGIDILFVFFVGVLTSIYFNYYFSRRHKNIIILFNLYFCRPYRFLYVELSFDCTGWLISRLWYFSLLKDNLLFLKLGIHILPYKGEWIWKHLEISYFSSTWKIPNFSTSADLNVNRAIFTINDCRELIIASHWKIFKFFIH